MLDAPGPLGCICLNDAEQEILDYGVPPVTYQQMLADIEAVARDNCDATVPAGWDHNCYIDGGAEGSVPNDNPSFFDGGLGECIGSCSFIHPPPNGTCPELNPYQCEAQDGGAADDLGGGDDSAETGVDIDDVTCNGDTCIIGRALAEAAYADPLRFDP
ncbi:MAG: hypothetical protein KC457_34240, partial [Myxococcales bacterium]|nr:hypothetical protein [Myxococcales bacterium]